MAVPRLLLRKHARQTSLPSLALTSVWEYNKPNARMRQACTHHSTQLVYVLHRNARERPQRLLCSDTGSNWERQLQQYKADMATAEATGPTSGQPSTKVDARGVLEDVELRIDPIDGQPYTQPEFVGEYGGYDDMI